MCFSHLQQESSPVGGGASVVVVIDGKHSSECRAIKLIWGVLNVEPHSNPEFCCAEYLCWQRTIKRPVTTPVPFQGCYVLHHWDQEPTHHGRCYRQNLRTGLPSTKEYVTFSTRWSPVSNWWTLPNFLIPFEDSSAFSH